MYQYVLFDLDGTLTDPKEGITKSIRYALKQYGIEATMEELIPFIGPPLGESFKHYYGFSEEKAKEAIEKYREYYSEKGIYENTLYEGIDLLLKELYEKGVRIILATSKPLFFAKKVLEYFKIDQYFYFVAGSELNGVRGEKHEVIEYAIKHASIDITKAIMVGDRKFDINGARMHHIDTIALTFGYGSIEELQEAGAYKIVDSVAQLKKELL